MGEVCEETEEQKEDNLVEPEQEEVEEGEKKEKVIFCFIFSSVLDSMTMKKHPSGVHCGRMEKTNICCNIFDKY